MVSECLTEIMSTFPRKRIVATTHVVVDTAVV